MSKRAGAGEDPPGPHYAWILDPVPTNLHTLNKAAAVLLLADESLVPGVNSCAVCARAAPVSCPDCQSVRYCSRKCAAEDGAVHARVCSLLRRVRQLEAHGATRERVEHAVQEVLHWVKEPARVASWAELLPHVALQSLEAESSICRTEQDDPGGGGGRR